MKENSRWINRRIGNHYSFVYLKYLRKRTERKAVDMLLKAGWTWSHNYMDWVNVKDVKDCT